MPEFRVIIPARFASTRLPGKPLLDIAGKPMVQRVYEQAKMSAASDVIVATDDSRIQAAVESFGGKVVFTSSEHASGTDRLEEVVRFLSLSDDEIIVNVQGDEPQIPPSVINQVANNLGNSDASMATLCEKIQDEETAFDPNAVKVVMDKSGYALYFSRAPIPWNRANFSAQGGALQPGMALYRHIGIYAYRASFLHEYVGWEPCELEQTESLEQLRALWHGKKIHVERAQETPPPGVDTLSDLEKVRAAFIGKA